MSGQSRTYGLKPVFWHIDVASQNDVACLCHALRASKQDTGWREEKENAALMDGAFVIFASDLQAKPSGVRT